jgi:hypothetical protein
MENFCANCGQRVAVKRITFKEGWFDFWSRIYGFDGMFPRTLRDLTIRPGVAAQRFINGNRTMYYGPVGYFFLMITLMLLLFSLLDISFIELINSVQQNIARPETSRQAVLVQKVQTAIANNVKVFFFGWIPFQAIAARNIFFRKSELNLVEHMVMPLYAMGHVLWVTIFLGIIYKLNGHFYTGTAIISLLYFGFAYSTFMSYQGRAKAFFKGMGVYLVGYLSFILAMIFVAVVIGLVVAVVNPEALKAWMNV